MGNNGVRKGAWTKEEDILLKNCINKYGEGNWHKVPPRAGLSRCRKSCRMRWLNYLRPNLKRGYFTKDEVDLTVRLHKLLGNRWSLIAGRIPGRTANDVKNFWNTHIAKKTSTEKHCRTKTMQESIPAKDMIIKPQPRTFSKLHDVPIWSSEVNKTNEENTNKPQSSPLDEVNDQYLTKSVELPPQNQLSEEEIDDCIQWWGNLLQMTENGDEAPFSFSDQDVGGNPIMQPMISPGPGNNQSNEDGWSDLMSLDYDVLGH